MQITAAVLRANRGPFQLERADLDEPRPDEVVVRVAAVGICRTDIEFAQFFPTPVVLGHEASGWVAAVGTAVRGFEVGQPVVLTSASCGTCPRCLGATPTYCDHFDELNFAGRRPDGTSALHGADGPLGGHFLGQSSFATYATAPARSVIPVPDEAAGQLRALGPFGCGFQTGAGTVLACLRPAPGSALAVFGAGAVGLAAIAAAALAGCRPIVALDVSDARLSRARSIGATHAINSSGEDPGTALAAIAPGGFDATIDTTGRAEVVQAAVAALHRRGTCAVVGVGPSDEVRLDWRTLLNGRTVTGVIGGGGMPQLLVPRLLRWFADGRLPLGDLLDYYPFAEIDRAVSDAAAGRTVKAVVVVEGDIDGPSPLR